MQALDIDALTKKISLGPRQIYRLVSLGCFPVPARPGNKNLWREDEVDAWLSAQFAKRPAAEPPACPVVRKASKSIFQRNASQSRKG